MIEHYEKCTQDEIDRWVKEGTPDGERYAIIAGIGLVRFVDKE